MSLSKVVVGSIGVVVALVSLLAIDSSLPIRVLALALLVACYMDFVRHIDQRLAANGIRVVGDAL